MLKASAQASCATRRQQKWKTTLSMAVPALLPVQGTPRLPHRARVPVPLHHDTSHRPRQPCARPSRNGGICAAGCKKLGPAWEEPSEAHSLVTNGWPQPGGGVGKQRLEDTRGSTTEQSLTVTGCKSLGEAPPQETLAAEEGFLEAGLGPRSPSGCSDTASPAGHLLSALDLPTELRHCGHRDVVGRKAGCGRPCVRTARTPLTAASPHSPALHDPRRDRKCVTGPARPSTSCPLPGVPRPASAVSLGALGLKPLALHQSRSVGSDA
ncbi:hypothetical protein NN561_006957 [Cricetulus griseus]